MASEFILRAPAAFSGSRSDFGCLLPDYECYFVRHLPRMVYYSIGLRGIYSKKNTEFWPYCKFIILFFLCASGVILAV